MPPGSPMHDKHSSASQAMAALWQTVAQLETEAISQFPGGDVVEGRRFLLRMLGASIDTFVEHGDFERPVFHHAESPTRKMFADNPDADYLRAPIRLGPGRVYRLWGRIPAGTLYVGILLYGKGGRIGHRLTDAQLDLDQDGRFELWVSTEPQQGTWLRGDGDETAIMVRQYFTDRGSEQPIAVHIERMGELPPVGALQDQDLARQLQLAERMLQVVVRRTVQARSMAGMVGPNQFLVLPGEGLFPTPDNTYAAAWYERQPGQRLVMRGRLPRARYFSVALYNGWLESFDYQRHQVALNHSRLVVDDEGHFEIVLADEAPGSSNWLDTAGHDRGVVLVRVLLIEEEMPSFTIEPERG